MLIHSPPLPLVIDFYDAYLEPTAEEVDGILFALKRRDLVRCIRLRMPVPTLQSLIMAMDEEYPVLEHLIMGPDTRDDSTALMPLESLRAPHLRHLKLLGFALPIGYRLLTTSVGLVTLALVVGHPSSYFQPDFLLRWLSCIPQVEKLQIDFYSLDYDCDVERPIMTNVTLSNLRCFEFYGVSTYMEAVVHRITTPHLKWLRTLFFHQLMFSTPSFLPFLNTTEDLRFDSAEFGFSRSHVNVGLYLRDEPEVYISYLLLMTVLCIQQVSSMAQLFNSPGQIFSTVEHLTLEQKSKEQSEAESTEWLKFLRLFRNVKTLRVDDGLVKELTRCLRPDDGEHPQELFPELQELAYSGSGDIGDAFTSFVDARQNADRPVILVGP